MNDIPTLVCVPKGVVRPYSWIPVEEILHTLPELNIHGFRCYGKDAISDERHAELRAQLLRPDVNGALAPQKALDRWLRSFLPTNRQWRHDSDDLKYIFKRETGMYLANGAFIVGVLQSGLSIKHESGPNCRIAARRPAL